MAEDILRNWQKKSGERQKIYKHFLQRPDKNKVLKQLPELHEEAFARVNCLECANCCKNYSPRFKTPDVKRISRHLKMRESDFIDKYLRVDEDGDFVAKTSPVPSWVTIITVVSMTSAPQIVIAFPIPMKMFLSKGRN